MIVTLDKLRVSIESLSLGDECGPIAIRIERGDLILHLTADVASFRLELPNGSVMGSRGGIPATAMLKDAADLFTETKEVFARKVSHGNPDKVPSGRVLAVAGRQKDDASRGRRMARGRRRKRRWQ